MAQKKKVFSWVRLDNSAKIYPAARRRNWSNVFRESVTLREEVDVAVLEKALDVTVKRFPTIVARLRKGMFWYYLQEVEAPPAIREEHSYPLAFMSGREMRSCALRVLVYHNRIAVEFFHSLTDGNGALVFLKSLTAEYLGQKHGITIPCEHGVLDRRETPTANLGISDVVEMMPDMTSFAGEAWAKMYIDPDYTAEQAQADIIAEWENLDYASVKEIYNEKAAELGL